MKNNVVRILSIVLPIVVVAVLGSIFVNIGMVWFDMLRKPSQWIPNWVIPVVWTIIYILFVGVLLNWTSKEEIPLLTKILLIVNGVLNVLWCLIFFALKQTFGGNIIIIINLIASILLWINIYKNNKIYGYILGLYPIWLSIATTLNTAMWIIN